MQSASFVAQPRYLSMAAMRRVMSPTPSSTDDLSRPEMPQAHNSLMFPPSPSPASPASSLMGSPSVVQRKPRGKIALGSSEHIIRPMASSPLEMATLAASGPPQMSYQPDVYDPNAEDSDEEECCDDMEDDMAMWSSHRVVQRSAPIAIPGSRRRGEVRMAASERMGAPPTMMSMLVHEGAARTTDGRGNWSTRSMLDLMRTSPFAPMTSGDEIVPGKPETGDSRKLKMAYFDEGALW